MKSPIPAGAGLNRETSRPARRGCPDPRRRGAQPCQEPKLVPLPDRSPQARGSTGRRRRARPEPHPIPAGAGLNRKWTPSRFSTSADPRRRGAQPNPPVPGVREPCRSPQARGSTAWHRARHARSWPDPRRRGAQPSIVRVPAVVLVRSPQARGSTAVRRQVAALAAPIPAGAGLNRQ